MPGAFWETGDKKFTKPDILHQNQKSIVTQSKDPGKNPFSQKNFGHER